MASNDTPSAGPEGRVHALFNLDVKTEAPFPTNWFTVSNHSNLTNQRVHLPLSDCNVLVSDCDRATFYRNDLAFAEDPSVPRDPHTFRNRIDNANGLVAAIAVGAQRQTAAFFASGGAKIIHPEPARFFEVPIKGRLPEDLNYIP